MKTIINGRLIIPNDDKFTIVENSSITFDDKIISIGDAVHNEKIIDSEIIDAQGMYVSAGFINIHIHGIANADAMDGTIEALECMQQALPKYGVTAFLPTTMTEPLEKIHKALNTIKQSSKKNTPSAKILGANIEGPYINPHYKGAQAECNIRTPNFDEFADFADVVRIMTVAPEMIEDENFVEECLNAGIILSIGHSGADYETALSALSSGFSHITHLFNAQTGLHHRKPGIVGAAFDTDATVELIADNVHVHPMLQRLVWRVKDHSKIILITDSLRAAGLGDVVSELGGQKVTVKDGIARLDDGTIAASVATMNEVMRKFAENTGATVEETVELVTKNPARELDRYEQFGSLEVGKCADIVIFDEKFNIYETFVDGRTVFKN